MPFIHLLDTGEVFEADLVTSLLVCLQRNGKNLQAMCGGRAQCGQCAVRIVRGTKFLTRMGEAERARLDAIGADEDVRLACQTFTRGDVEIKILNPPFVS
jgi:ferredoxin